MQRFLLTLGFLFWFASSALALPSYCTLTGTVLSPDGTACAGCKITITTAGTQEVGGSTFPGGKARSWTTESDGDLPAGVEAARTLIVKIQIDKGATVTVQIPDTSTADISTLLLEPIDVPSSTNINSLSGTLSVTKGGTGAAPDGDDQVLVSTGTTAADWETIPDCDGVTKALNYDVTTNTFTCNSTVSATDLACTGCVAAADLASDAVTEAKLKAVDSPADEECLTYETTTGDFEWQTCGGGGGGTGDIEVVGDCTTGECFTAASGNNSLIFEGATADTFETTLTTIDPVADATVSLPKRTGTLALEKVVNLYDYAACDGTDEATEIQAAITAACALGPGGTLYVPADTCSFASTLTLCSGLAIIGSEKTDRVSTAISQPHTLSYSGTGTAIDGQTFVGIRLSGLFLYAANASFSSGVMLDLDDADYIYIERTYIVASTGQAGAATSRAISANNVVGLWISGSAFSRFGYHIYGRASSVDFANNFNITDTVFYRAEACSIQNLGDTANFTGNWWQQQGASDDESNMICHGSGICSEGVEFSGNMSVDQPSGPTVAMFDICGGGWSITGNFFGGGTTQDGIGISEPCNGCSIQGNWFGFNDSAVLFSGTGDDSEGLSILSNAYHVTTSVVAGTRPPRSIMQETAGTYINETGDIWLNADADADSGSGAVVIGSNAASTSGDQQYVFFEDGYATFRRGNDLRFYDSVANGNDFYVEFSLGTANLGSNKVIAIPDAAGTLAVSATAPVVVNATTGNVTLTQNAGTDVTADLEEETHATEHSLGGTDPITVTNLASACTNGQVLGGTAGGTGVECQADVDTDTNASTLCAGTTTYLDGEGNCDDISSVYAPIGATFITQTASAALTGEQAMGSLGTGIVINTTTTGVQSIYAGASCTNQFPRALSASGAATCASVVSADITDGTITAADTALTGGVGVDINTNDIVADLTEIDSPTWSNGGSASLTHTWNLSGTDPVLTLQSGAFNLTGNTLIGGTASGNDLTLQSTSNATRGSIFFGSEWEWLDQIPDAADGTTYSGGLWNPTLSITGAAGTTSYSFGLDLNPTVNLDDASGVSISFMGAMRARGTFTRSGAATYVPAFYLLYADATNTSATDGLGPMGTALIYDNLLNSYTSTGSTTATLGRASTVWSNHIIQTNGDASTRLDVGSDYGFYWTTHLSETTGILNVTNVIGAKFETPALGGTTPQITTIAAVDIDKMTGATTDAGNIGIRNKSTTVFAPTTTQAIAAVGNTITCDETYKKFTTFTGTNALTSNPSITDGATGQICILQNVDATATDCITLTDSTLGMQLAGNDTLCPNDTITLVYDGTDWVETARSNN